MFAHSGLLQAWKNVTTENCRMFFVLVPSVPIKNEATGLDFEVTPTAHLEDDGEAVFQWPTTQETLRRTLIEVDALTRYRAQLNLFMLGEDYGLRRFVDHSSCAQGKRQRRQDRAVAQQRMASRLAARLFLRRSVRRIHFVLGR